MSEVHRHLDRQPALLGGDSAFPTPIYVTRALAPDAEIFGQRTAGIFRSRWFTNDGPTVQELEELLAIRLGVSFCAAFASGTVALQTALRALDLSGEVITTPFTFPATVHAITWAGLSPVFCDVDPETYNVDVRRVEELISPRTSAILPVHVFGNPCDVLALEKLARSYGLKIVYDAAHAFGSSYLERSIGSWGDLTVFSFHATKIFHTAEGGAAVGQDPRLCERLASLRNFGIVNEEEVRGIGTNGKMSELHAAVGLAVLERSAEEVETRQRLAAYYDERLSAVEGVVLQRFPHEAIRNGYNFTIEIDARRFGLCRDEVHIALRAENIITRKYFSPLCSENESYRMLPSADPKKLPNAHRLASRILSLPLYGDLDFADIDRIVDALVALRTHAGKISEAIACRQ